MKFIIAILLTMLMAYSFSLYLPWWSIAIAGFIVGFFIYQRSGFAFMAGFFALFLLWAILAWFSSADNDHILAQKISMLVIKSDNAIVLIGLTAFLGALTGGMGALTGSLLRNLTLSGK
jgi:hypothetical protein